MNFYGHLAIGVSYSTDPAFLLGSMLPDFASMAGIRRIVAGGLQSVSDGIRFHHETDAVFHRAPAFADLTARGLTTLEGAGLARGTARAVAHVGLELLLDGLVLERPDGPGLAPYLEALTAAESSALQRQLHTERGAFDPRLAVLVARLRQAPVPDGYRQPAFVAERLQRMLAGRPRLAMAEGDTPLVSAWLSEIRATLAAQTDTLLQQVHAGLLAG